jgi:hypothetical protein
MDFEDAVSFFQISFLLAIYLRYSTSNEGNSPTRNFFPFEKRQLLIQQQFFYFSQKDAIKFVGTLDHL